MKTISQPDTEINEIYPNQWKFPHRVDFETTSTYINKMDGLDRADQLTFDLSDTEIVHSSFIGFLIDTKRKCRNNDREFNLLISPYLEKIFRSLEIYDYLLYN